MKKILLFTLLFFKFYLLGQSTVGLIDYQIGNEAGYVLFSPMASKTTYLIDKCGNKVKEWISSYNPGLSSYLLEDGSLLRTGTLDNPNFDAGGSGGIIQKFDWDGNLTWTYTISDNDQCQHHDLKFLPNGNILVIVWDRYTNTEAIAQGKNTTYSNDYLWSEKIIELQPSGTNDATIIWEWKLWDHLIQDFDNTKPNYGVVADHPELVNLNYFPGQPTSMDWIHFNSIDYNSSLDQIVLSSHTMCEIWIIDHSTSTAQAKTHLGGNSGIGGDLMYRWGNSQAYQRGNPSTKKLYGQHHATWIPTGFPNAGKILVFNNGLNRTVGIYSSIDIIETPINSDNQYPIVGTSAFTPVNLFWSYTSPTPTDFYASNISGVYPLENGSLMISNGTNGNFIELNSSNEIVWKYINPVNNTGFISQGTTASSNLVFRCNFYPETYSAFTGRTIIDFGELELNPTTPSICDVFASVNSLPFEESEYTVFPNPSSELITINLPKNEKIKTIEIINSFGKTVIINSTEIVSITDLENGIYFLKVTTVNGNTIVQKVIKQ